MTALAMMVFAVMGLIMTGLAGQAVELMEQHQFLPLAASLGALAVIFASSGTRDFRYYHPVESIIVGLTGLAMLAHAFLTDFQDFLASYDPWGAVVLLLLMVVTSAILAR